MECCINVVSQGYFNVVFLLRKAVRFYEIFMKEIVVVCVKTGGSRVGGPELCI